MQILFATLLILFILPFTSYSDTIVVEQEKYKIVTSAKAYSTYPYFSIYNFSLTDIGSSVAFVTHQVPTQDKSFIKIDSLGAIFPLTNISGHHGDNYTGIYLTTGGLAMSKNEQYYYYVYRETALSKTSQTLGIDRRYLSAAARASGLRGR